MKRKRKNHVDNAHPYHFEETDYVIFPLNSLSLHVNYKLLIRYILYYSIAKISIKRFKTALFYEDKIEQGEYPEYYTSRLESMRKYLNDVSKMIGCKCDVKKIYKGYRVIKNHNDKFEEKYGRDSNILIGTELLLDILNENALRERAFRILCAIYSKIGQSAYQIIYNSEIQIRAYGCKSDYVFKKEFPEKSLKLYSKRILGYEIPILKEGFGGRAFFDRVRDGRRYYYSRTIRGDYLDNIVLKKKLNNSIVRGLAEQSRNKQLDKKYKNIVTQIKTDKFNISDIDNLCNLKVESSNFKRRKDKFLRIGKNL